MNMDDVTSASPVMNVDKETTYEPSLGLPLGIYTNHYGKGCRRNSRGSYNENCKFQEPGTYKVIFVYK